MTAPRPPRARRSWLFLPGAEAAALAEGPACGADVLIQELEDFTPPGRRAEARRRAPEVLAAWRRAGRVAAVRINPLAGDGMADLAAVMAGAPHAVLLPKCREADEVRALDAEVAKLEAALGLGPGSTELVPNVEDARGLRLAFEIATASPRVTACLVASEDMAADLGAERGRDGTELAHVRARFLVDCRAAGVVAIDCPYTWRDQEGLEAETRHARRLGYTAKSAVMAAHAAPINALLTPTPAEIAQAREIVAAFEAAAAAGRSLVEVAGSQVEMPACLNARRLLDRVMELQAADRQAAPGT